MKLLREPLVHFLIIGAAIYLAYGLLSEPTEVAAENTIVISAGEIDWMKTSWQKRWNRPPTDAELEGMIDQYVRETVLYREALAMGLDKDDTIIRRRLAQKLEFLAQDLAALHTPTEEELQAWFKDRQQNYQEPTRITLTQVFVDPDKRGDATLADAESIKAKLSTDPNTVQNAAEFGDRFMLQSYYPERSVPELQKLFGGGFTDSLQDLTTGRWHGPVLSGYGVHLVYVHSRTQPPAPSLSEVRDRVIRDWEDEQRQSLNEQFYAGLKERYTIVIEDGRPSADQLAAVRAQSR